MKKLIITGDDFGLALPVNEAIEEAHVNGILTAASLMVGARAAADAVERAHRLPSLGVGLHLVLVEGLPILPPESIPDLIGSDGEFSSHRVRAGINFFFKPGVRRQLAAEIRSQFQAFRTTNLPLDHVNSHNHMHLHPTVLSIILKVGKEFGLKTIRVPYEPLLPSWLASRKGLFRKLVSWLFLSPWIFLLHRRLRRAQLRSNKFVFGMNDSGNMQLLHLLRFLHCLPEGVSEIYFHPATRRCPEIERTMPDYHHEAELEALTSPVTRQTLSSLGIEKITFSDLWKAK
ncbi:MAG: hopanoid biosynthesis-associated protein HpnK [Candidatus Tectomicrobia bacterium]|uniref:Hopanoid biosynthesis-associated protein HpnK n=1 Tax=Tectimicrobiota bacterium TaxID=2528274 RepID=A0A933GLX7_UNCTE|nr:hopanoid biosynthesis-associated protein HpnK [Candidatus Tectomicrobia bacterium]